MSQNSIILIVIIAAFASALWHSLIKGSSEKLVFNCQMGVVQVIACFFLIFFIPLPQSTVWKFIIVAAFLHNAYDIFVAKSYVFGEISHVFPLARGLAAILILVVEYTFFRHYLTLYELLGVLFLSVGVMGFTVLEPKFFQGKQKASIIYAIITAILIMSFSIVDAKGVRLAMVPWTFIVWMYFLKGIFNTTLMLLIRKGDLELVKINNYQSLSAGLLSSIAYSVVLWCFTYEVTSLVVALRVTAVVFSLILAVILHKELLKPYRILSSCVIIFGVFLLAMN